MAAASPPWDLYRHAFEACPDALFIIDKDSGLILEANRAASALYGYTREELKRLHNYDLSHEPTATRQAVAEERALVLERMHRRKDGSVFPVEITGSYARVGGRAVHVASVRDITERVHARRELETIFAMSLDLVCMADINTATFLKINPSFGRVLGHSEEALLGRPFLDFVHPDDLGPTVRVIEEQLKRGAKVLQFVNRYRRSDDTYVWLDWNSHPVPALGITYAIARDITDRVAADAALLESEHRFRELFDNMGNGVAVYQAVEDGDDFVIRDFNRAAECLAERRREEVVGRRLTEVFPGVRDLGLFAMLQRVWRTGTPERLPARVYEDSRLQAWFENYVYKLPAGEVVAVFDNVTDREQSRLERARLEEQLRHAQKMEAVGRLAGGIAHDFNNLLAGIMGNVSLAQLDTAPHDPLVEVLGEAMSAAERAAELTGQLLAFSRRQVLSRRAVDLNRLLQGVARMLKRTIGEDIELALLPGENLGAIRADPGRMEQVIVNLVINARDAMPDGGRLTIETHTTALDGTACAKLGDVAPGRYTSLVVRDSGCGIPREHRQKIFDPFFTTKPTGQGTGLGLSTVFGIVKQHGGAIEVESQEGVGTTFSLHFPRVDAEVDADESGPPVAPMPGGDESILLVEDEPAVRKMAARVLRRLGYRVLEAGNGPAALALVTGRGEKIDLLLTDVVMPGMNGKELATEVRRLVPGVRVVYTSGYAEDVIAPHGVLEAETSLIAKPYSSSTLAQHIRRALDAR